MIAILDIAFKVSIFFPPNKLLLPYPIIVPKHSFKVTHIF